jgi:hypothetical protein
MSFDPQYDPECNVKCQESNSLPDTEMFLDDELAYFAAFSQAIGLGEDQWVSPSIFLNQRIETVTMLAVADAILMRNSDAALLLICSAGRCIAS